MLYQQITMHSRRKERSRTFVIIDVAVPTDNNALK
jgi:hypothetical protein